MNKSIIGVIIQHLAKSRKGLFISAILFSYALTDYWLHSVVGYICWLPFILDWNLVQLKKIRKEFKDELSQSNKNIYKTLKKSNTSLANHITKERKDRIRGRSERILSFVRRDSSGKLPNHCVILMTIHRSGSTWMFDSIRCHPNIYFEPQYLLFDLLGLKGGRYPTGLANNVNDILDVEISKGLGAKIPDFNLPKGILDFAENKFHRTYAIEKIHPSFLDHEIHKFIDRIKNLESEHKIEFTFFYQIRDPRSVFSSFINYQKRDPNWYADISPDDLPIFIMNSYQNILDMTHIRPGFIIDYPKLVDDPKKFLGYIYGLLWPSSDKHVLEAIADAALEMTDRSMRLNQSSKAFISTEIGKEKGGDLQHSEYFENHADTIDRCNKIYSEILRQSGCQLKG